MKKYKIGDMSNGQEVSEVIIECDNYVDALERTVEDANLYCRPVEDESNETITITVKGGCVTDVQGVPKGFDYEIKDLD